MKGSGRVWILVLGLLAGSGPARGMIFLSTSNASYNTSAPTGALANSGWQWLGIWSSYIGTPIAPRYFITAGHFGGSTNWTFRFADVNYQVVAGFDDPGSDLVIWEVAQTFPTYAPLFEGTNEVGQMAVVFGRGYGRGEEVTVNGQLKGWRWNTTLNWTWGENQVAAVTNRGAGLGELLRLSFDRDGGSNECHLAERDSGGPLYLWEGGAWRLAGIHYAVDGPFKIGAGGTSFNAALFDKSGLYEWVGGQWIFHNNTSVDKPSAFYSTRISSRLNWIRSVVDFEPGTDLRITNVTTDGADVVLRFATSLGKVYRVEWREAMTAGNWQTLTNGVAGTGAEVGVMDAGAGSLPRRFYRVGLVPP